MAGQGRQFPNFGDDAECWASVEIPKHVWIELYADLYRQTHGEGETDGTILADAIKRAGLIGREAQAKAADRVARRVRSRKPRQVPLSQATIQEELVCRIC